MNLTELLARFERPTRSGDQWQVICPAHEDHKASLSIGEGKDGRLLVHCKAGCTLETILERLGLTKRDLFPATEKTKASIVATYDYHNAEGVLVYQVVRYTPKNFKQRRPNGSGGWVWKMDGVARVLYHLPLLANDPIAYLVEGEKDADRLRSIDLPGTTAPGGADKWKPLYADQLTAAGVTHVVVIPDNDDPGRQHAAAIAASCHAAGLSVKVVELPGLAVKGDVSDYLDAGHLRDELITLVRQTPRYPETSTVPVIQPAEAHHPRLRYLATLLDDVGTFIKKYVVLTAQQALLVSAWVAHTHAFEASDTTPYMHVTSPEPECGKSRLLEILTPLVRRGWMTAYTTKATLVRRVDRLQPTLLFDEFDTALKSDVDTVEALRGVLNSGYTRSGKYSMCVGQGAALTDKDFHTFCPKMLCGIGTLPRTIASRAIPIALKRRAKHEPAEKWHERDGLKEAASLFEELTAWAPTAVRTLRVARPAMPEGLRDRSEDVLEPLFAIADVAGDHWPADLRAAAVAVLGTQAIEDDSTGLQLLADIRDIFSTAKGPDGKPADALFSTTLREHLCELEDRPWSSWGKQKKPITGVAVANLLKRYGVTSADKRIGTKTGKAYSRALFEDAWLRYLPINPQHRNNPNETGPEAPNSNPQHVDDVADSKSPVSPITTASCCGVAGQTPDHGDTTEEAEPETSPDDEAAYWIPRPSWIDEEEEPLSPDEAAFAARDAEEDA